MAIPQEIGRRGWVLALGALVLFVAPLPGQPPALAATHTVTTTLDLADLNPADGVCDGSPAPEQQCSLRAAIQTANAEGGAHSIMLSAATFGLNISGEDDLAVAGDLDIHADLTLVGESLAASLIDGQGVDRVLDVQSGGSLQLQQVSVTHGWIAGEGGGVRVLGGGTLRLDDAAVTDNQARAGGGIFALPGSVVILDYAFLGGNIADETGGGIFSQGSLTMRNSALRRNTATAQSGGGLTQLGGTLLLENAAMTSNTAATRGGGCDLSAPADSLQATLRDVSLAENVTATDGGGCFIGAGVVATFEGGLVINNGSGRAGAGIFNTGVLTLNRTMVQLNRAGAFAGGIANVGGTVTSTDAVFDRNSPDERFGAET